MCFILVWLILLVQATHGHKGTEDPFPTPFYTALICQYQSPLQVYTVMCEKKAKPFNMESETYIKKPLLKIKLKLSDREMKCSHISSG